MVDARGFRTRAEQALFALISLAFCGISFAQDGLYDTTWGGGGRLQVDNLNVYVAGALRGLLVAQSDGNLLLAGNCFNSTGGAPYCAARRHADGSVDTSFAGGGAIVYDSLPNGLMYAATAAPGGKTLFAGTTFDFAPLIVRINADGTLDTSANHGLGYLSFQFFVPSVGSPLGAITAICPLPSGAILVAGLAVNNDQDVAVARLLPDLSGLDPTFGNGGVRLIALDLGGTKGDEAHAMTVQADGKIIIAGQAAYDNGNQGFLLRLTNNGSLDTSFGTGGKFFFTDGAHDQTLWSVAIDTAGRVVTAGGSFDGEPFINHDFFVTRITADGQFVDMSFGLNGNAVVPFNILDGSNETDDMSYALAFQHDGKIVVAGQAQSSFSLTAAGAARLTAQGVLDPTFGTGGKFIGTFAPAPSAGVDDSVRSVAVTSDAIFLGGAGIDAAGAFERLGIIKLSLDCIFGNGFD